ncbi:PREDICTED: serine-rich adhesin for platelets-like isoform X2 [Trachymyrmex septentrionalis]|uniref:serine-rich adhesin for platelets-like isoform X2 n=1 Tax=Trachymyrmex septentrionalis TaxID=34720 RepID=UPI00084F6D62|nr:PREDICTED: serine-rich adhesin for platelets-like isoform X2 [Trachymyrmex septentrionalis]
MNLALHGFLLQIFVSILDFRHGRLLCSAGEPGYLDFDNLPETNFSCQGKVIGGYYADVEAGCQMFHVCTIGQKDEIMDIKFLCLNGTVFDQETRVCERVDEVDCSKSERFYNLNLELYGNNAVTLSLNGDDEDDLTIDPVEDHQSRTTSARPSTTSTTSTTTSRPSKPSTTAASGSFQHPAGYPQHYQPQPPFPQVHTSQSKSLYDDKNGGYHHQYIFHNGGERASNQATSYQLFSNQGAVSSTTVPPAPLSSSPPQIHQIRYSSTVGPPPQIIHSEPSTVTPLFATSSTIQTLLNSNANNPAALINPIFHNHGIASTTEHFSVHSNNPRETTDYRDDDQEQDIRALEAIQSVNKGKISKLTISPVPSQQESSRIVQTKTSQTSQQRISSNFLPTPATIETTMRSFYPTPRPSPKSPQSLQSVTHQVTQHIHVPQLKPHQITINLPPPDIQRIVQNPSPLLPSQSRVIVTAKASVSDESGRPLNTTQLVTLPLPTIPASYDDYKEGDESFDPFYRDVPKIRKNRQNAMENIRFSRAKRSLEQPYHFVYGVDSRQDFKVIEKSEPRKNEDNAINKESTHVQVNLKDFRTLKESLIKFRDILFSDNVNEDFSSHNNAEENKNNTERVGINSKTFDTISIKQVQDNAIKKVDYLEDLKTEASKHLNLNKNTDEEEEDEITSHEDLIPNVKIKAEKSLDEKKHIKDTSELEIYIESTTAHPRKNESQGDVIDLIILDSNNNSKVKASAKTDAPIEIIITETKSDMHDASKTDEKVAHEGQIAGSLIKDDPGKQSNSVVRAGERRQLTVPYETIKRNGAKDGERKSGPRRKSSRPRSSKRRISSRIRQQRMENIEPTETIQQKERTTTATAVIDTTIVTSTSTTTTSTTTTSPTTVTPFITAFEKKVAEPIDSNIFGDSESQTFKELDTRAIGHRDAIYSKSLQDSKSYDSSRSKDIERSFDRQIVEEHTRSSELHADEIEEEKRETELPDYTQTTEGKDTTENPSNANEARSMEVAHVSEEKSSTEEEDPYKEYEFPDDDEADTNEGELKENSQDRSSKISSDEVATSREGNLEEESAYDKDTSEKSSTDISDEEQSSTANYNEEVNSEELNEYQDITESSAESARSIQEDYRDYPESTEGSTMDYTNPEEYTDSQEDVAASTEDGEGSTEGVLKFTDELPLSDDNEDEEATEESLTSNENDAHDYVDDNYEPENYKTEIAMKSDEFEEDKSEEKNDEEKKDTSAKDPDRMKNIENSDDSIEVETQTDHVAGITKIKDLGEIASLTTTSSTTTPALTTTTSSTTESTTTTSSTTASTMTISTTTDSTITASSSTPITTTTARSTTITRRPKTTTPRATPPKIFKPTGNKRIYAYIPPTTTPNPVVIKPRLGLFNPKPAKPIKSYNELAPKPTIRKLILPTRKSTTTTTEAITTTEMLNTDNPEIMTEPVIITTVASTTAALTTTATMATAMTTAATTETMAATTTTTATAATTTVIAMTTTTESSRSEENGLESKVETNDHISLDSLAKNNQTNKDNQLPSSSEQNTSANSSENTNPETTTTKIETFTPYPLLKLSTLAPSIERTTKEIESQETTEDIDTLVPTTIPPTTLLSEKSEYAEIVPSTEKYLEITETTTASTSKVYQQEISLVSSVPPVPERATSVSVLTTVLPKAEDSDPGASMEAAILKSSSRKLVKPRKHASFNCLEKEMYRFYGDFRDCRLFHYCSPGFTSRQVLDFRFVCEEGTAFDEVTQSCRHEVHNRKCRNRSW